LTGMALGQFPHFDPRIMRVCTEKDESTILPDTSAMITQFTRYTRL
jgi:hypothetical protein